MRKINFIITLAGILCGRVFATSPEITATYEPHALPSGRIQIDVRFTNYYSEDFILNTNLYSVVVFPGNTEIPIKAVGPLLPETNIQNVLSCKGVYLIGDFIQSESNSVIIKMSGEPPMKLAVSSSSTTNQTPWYAFMAHGLSFEIMPFDANGGGGLGLQYALTYSRSWPRASGDSISQFSFDATSKGQFGVTSGSSTSNSIQDTLTAELDLKYMLNMNVPDPIDKSNPNGIVYPVGFFVSPVGFEWNREFSLGDYAPKAALGGSLPYLDYLPMLWSSIFKLTNGFTPPTLFSGLSYIAPTTGKQPDVQAARVRDRWDTEFIYDMPVLNNVSFRFTWNSYIGIDHPMWKHYYQVGAVYYLSKNAKNANGVFFGYSEGAQPPSYVRTGSWQLGYTVKLQ